MTGLIESGFGRATSIPRRLKILPKNVSTPQKAIDVARGKEAARKGAVFSKAMSQVGRQTGDILDVEKRKDKRGRTILR
jgi:hypothetical protein